MAPLAFLEAQEKEMDADILAADALTIERIYAQECRNEVADLKAHRAAVRAHHDAMRAKVDAFIAWAQAQYATLPDPVQEKRLSLALAIAEKYFTTGTATLPESVELDAQNDARRFKAALEAALAAVG